jgi:hypothetical protein
MGSAVSGLLSAGSSRINMVWVAVNPILALSEKLRIMRRLACGQVRIHARILNRLNVQ